MTSSYRIAFLADTHLGYSAKVRQHPATGLNERVRDGYLALRETIDQILESEPDLVIHGGDLFHRSWPQVSDIAWARKQLARLATAGIPVLVNTGNHDASGERGKAPATAAIDDPDHGIHCITDPLTLWTPPNADGLTIHVLTHFGLAREERLIPEPITGDVNIFTAHGAAALPGHDLWRCIDSPGEQPIGVDLLTNPDWAVTLLGHYHQQGRLPDIGNDHSAQAWYAGSAIRRGFSDGPGKRGWLKVDINTDGSTTITPQSVTQRPQFDLPMIDAATLTGEEVHEAVKANLARIDTHDAIIRQVVVNVTSAHRAGMDAAGLNLAASDALQWLYLPTRPEAVAPTPDDAANESADTEPGTQDRAASLRTARSINLSDAYVDYLPDWAQRRNLTPDTAQRIQASAVAHLAAVVSLDDTTTNLPDAPSPAPDISSDSTTTSDTNNIILAPWDAPAADITDTQQPSPATDADDTITVIDTTTGQEVPW